MSTTLWQFAYRPGQGSTSCNSIIFQVMYRLCKSLKSQIVSPALSKLKEVKIKGLRIIIPPNFHQDLMYSLVLLFSHAFPSHSLTAPSSISLMARFSSLVYILPQLQGLSIQKQKVILFFPCRSYRLKPGAGIGPLKFFLAYPRLVCLMKLS